MKSNNFAEGNVVKDDSISDLEKCSKFAEQYDDGEKVEPFEFEIK